MKLEPCPSCNSTRIMTKESPLLGCDECGAYCECERCGDYSLSFSGENKVMLAQKEWNTRSREIKKERKYEAVSILDVSVMAYAADDYDYGYECGYETGRKMFDSMESIVNPFQFGTTEHIAFEIGCNTALCGEAFDRAKYGEGKDRA